MTAKYFFIAGFNEDTCKKVFDLLRQKLGEVTPEQEEYDFHLAGNIDTLSAFENMGCKGFRVTLKEKYGNRLLHQYYYHIPFPELKAFRNKIQPLDAAIMLFCFDFNYIQEGYCPSEYINEPAERNLKFNLNYFMMEMHKAQHRNIIFLKDENVHPLMPELLQHAYAGRPIDGIYLARLLNSIQHVGLYRQFLQLPTTLLSEQYFNLNLIAC